MRWTVLLAAGCMGCLSAPYCLDTECSPPAADTCEGQCVPFVGAGWAPVLVSTSAATCPDVAPFAAMQSSSVTACGVQDAKGECDDGYECLPAVPAWAACVVLRPPAAACPSPYPVAVEVPDASLCCPAEEPAR